MWFLHMFALIPMTLGSVLLVTGRIFNDLPLTGLSLILLAWGILIHANNLASLRKFNRNTR